jgi:hypothetical protein
LGCELTSNLSPRYTANWACWPVVQARSINNFLQKSAIWPDI